MATTELHREIEIDAAPQAVWSVLADTPRYAERNAFIHRLSGDLREGSKIEAQITPPLVRFAGKALDHTATGFEQMNAALRQEAETRNAAHG